MCCVCIYTITNNQLTFLLLHHKLKSVRYAGSCIGMYNEKGNVFYLRISMTQKQAPSKAQL